MVSYILFGNIVKAFGRINHKYLFAPAVNGAVFSRLETTGVKVQASAARSGQVVYRFKKIVCVEPKLILLTPPAPKVIRRKL